jgi:hypothetical protein
MPSLYGRWQARHGQAPARFATLAGAALLLAAVWLIPLSVAYHGFTDPERTYRASGLEATDPWSDLTPEDEATSIRVIRALAVTVGLVGLLGLVGTAALVLSGRVGTVLGAVVATSVVLLAALYLRGHGFWTAWSLVLAVLAWLAGTVGGLVGAMPRGARQGLRGHHRPGAL